MKELQVQDTMISYDLYALNQKLAAVEVTELEVATAVILARLICFH
jgi:hypothetical protein